jgi:hypothetical protein
MGHTNNSRAVKEVANVYKNGPETRFRRLWGYYEAGYRRSSYAKLSPGKKNGCSQIEDNRMMGDKATVLPTYLPPPCKTTNSLYTITLMIAIP